MDAASGDEACAICALHRDADHLESHEIWRSDLWLLRHHPGPAPLAGWCLLDARRHCGGPMEFAPKEAREWGLVVQQASRLVQRVSGCDRVYAIAFGEGARHLHLHLIPRESGDARTTAWGVADHYRNVEEGRTIPASDAKVRDWLVRARAMAPDLFDESFGRDR